MFFQPTIESSGKNFCGLSLGVLLSTKYAFSDRALPLSSLRQPQCHQVQRFRKDKCLAPCIERRSSLIGNAPRKVNRRTSLFLHFSLRAISGNDEIPPSRGTGLYRELHSFVADELPEVKNILAMGTSAHSLLCACR